MEQMDVVLKLLRYSQLITKLTECNLEKGDQFEIQDVEYEVIERVDNRWTSATCWAVKKHNTDKTVVVFKSTKEIFDFFVDALAFRVRFKHSDHKIKAHAGFVMAYSSIRKKVNKIIKQSINNGEKITFLGHSLGGAMATLALLDFEKHFPDSPLSAYTIGSPRVLSKKSARIVEDIVDYSTRGWNKKDPITGIPPKWFGYTHVGDSYRMEPWCGATKGLFRYHMMKPYIEMFERGIVNE